MKFKNETGSAAVETALASAFLVLVVSGGLVSSYLAFARVWISRSAYEGVICLATDAAKHECQRQTRERIEQALPVGRLTALKMTKTKTAAVLDLRFELSEAFAIRVRHHQPLPLQPEGARTP